MAHIWSYSRFCITATPLQFTEFRPKMWKRKWKKAELFKCALCIQEIFISILAPLFKICRGTSRSNWSRIKLYMYSDVVLYIMRASNPSFPVQFTRSRPGYYQWSFIIWGRRLSLIGRCSQAHDLEADATLDDFFFIFTRQIPILATCQGMNWPLVWQIQWPAKKLKIL